MEKKEWIEGCTRVLTRLANVTVWDNFKFPKGGQVARVLGECYDALSKEYRIGYDRLVDFCICQVSAISRYRDSYRGRWNITHSFGAKAQCRYRQYNKSHRYSDTQWLARHKLSKESLVSLIRDRSHHPLERYIYPQYEEVTKRKWHSSDYGYVICGASTQMWTPFSPTCQKCTKASLCRERTEHVLHELYRLRIEAWNKHLLNE